MRAPIGTHLPKRTSRLAALALTATLVSAAPLMLASPASAAQAPKCKGASHLRVQTVKSGTNMLLPADVTIVVEKANCRNDVGYHGSVYVMVVNGKDGLHLLPDGATFVRQQFAAKAGHTVALDHPINQVFTDWHDFSDGARAKVVQQLTALGL